MNKDSDSMTAVAGAYAATIIDAVQCEYPNYLQHIMTGPDDHPTPRQVHPAFYGCFDWHSSVEMHWALIRLLRLAPQAVDRERALAILGAHLTLDHITAEARYFLKRPGFERPYGWGWALTLVHELTLWESGEAAAWGAALQPLAETVTDLYLRWLPTATYPIRVGLHNNSAFGLARAWPWARTLAARGDERLQIAITRAARGWFEPDAAYPAHLEPGGSDFLSPALTEAELMLAVLEPSVFTAWFDRFLPGLAHGQPVALFEPAVVSDARDGQTAHLHGLNLYRAFAFRTLAAALPADDPRRVHLQTAVERHVQASLSAVTGSDYMVEHWLACYAVLFLSAPTAG